MALYLSIAGAYCTFLLFIKFKDRECSKTDFASWLVVALASTLWTLVIPISLGEIRSKALAKTRLEEWEKSIDSAVNSKPVELVEQHKELDSNALTRITSKNT